MLKLLVTTTSFQDTPGNHKSLLNDQDYEIDYLRGPLKEEELLPVIGGYDAVLCGDDEYTERVLKKGKDGRLKCISKYGVGLDKIDLRAANLLNIPVKNCPGVNQISVSEHVLALLFAFEKNIHLHFKNTKLGKWNRFTGNEIQGKIIGILGLGAIGKELAKKANALGLKVIAYDIFKDDEFLKENTYIDFVLDIKEIYKRAEIISLHLPHTPETENIINEDVVFNDLQNKPIIINTSRGMLVDVKAIKSGLKSNQIRGYLTDVLINEPMDEEEELIHLENVIVTPHIGSRTYQSVEKQGVMAVENLIQLVASF